MSTADSTDYANLSSDVALHESFKQKYGQDRRLEYGLDFIKAMPSEWTDAQRWAQMVQLYDELLSNRRTVISVSSDDSDQRIVINGPRESAGQSP